MKNELLVYLRWVASVLNLLVANDLTLVSPERLTVTDSLAIPMCQYQSPTTIPSASLATATLATSHDEPFRIDSVGITSVRIAGDL